MKSYFEWDARAQNYVPKMSELQALTKSGQKLGSVQINLSDYAKPNNYKKKLMLNVNKSLDGGKTIGEGSYIQVEIETQDQGVPSGSKSGSKDGQKSRKPGNQLIEQLENQVDNETMKNHRQR